MGDKKREKRTRGTKGEEEKKDKCTKVKSENQRGKRKETRTFLHTHQKIMKEIGYPKVKVKILKMPKNTTNLNLI